MLDLILDVEEAGRENEHEGASWPYIYTQQTGTPQDATYWGVLHVVRKQVIGFGIP
jgi:hypothetical protein